MKKFRNVSSLAFLLSFFISYNARSQYAVFIPRKNEAKKEHERAIINLDNQFISIGSNLANIRILSPDFQVLQWIELGNTAQEIRDLAFCAGKLYAMQSNDSSSLYCVSLQNEAVKKINLNWQGKPIFFDGIASENNTLFLVGDPVNDTFCTFRSLDGGSNWEQTPAVIQANPGEAAYAASGQTNQILDGDFYFISGGLTSRLFKSKDFGASWSNSTIPYVSCPSCGPYAMAIKTDQEIMTVGGNYLEPNNQQNTCYYTTDGGKTWLAPKKGPSGYRSCVIYASNKYFACGTNGIDVSKNGGLTWKKISDQNCLSMVMVDQQLIVSLANGGYLIIED